MAEDDEAHRKVAVKVSGALGAGLLALAVPFTGWGVAGRGSWQATAAFGLAAGLLVAAAAQGLIWILMHVRRPIGPPPIATLPPPAPNVPALPTREEIDAKLVKLREYKDHVDQALNLAENGDAFIRERKISAAKLKKVKEQAETYLHVMLHPIAKLVAETGVYTNFQFSERKRQPSILLQAMGVLADAREQIPKPVLHGPVKPNVPPAPSRTPSELDSLLSLPPKEAVRTAWQLVETGVGALVEKEGVGDQPLDGALERLAQRGYIDAAAVTSITGLHRMFRLTEGPTREVTRESASEFLRLAEAVLWLVRGAHRKAQDKASANHG